MLPSSIDYRQTNTVNREIFVVKIFSDNMGNAKINEHALLMLMR